MGKPRLFADIAIATLGWFDEYRLVHASQVQPTRLVHSWSLPEANYQRWNVDPWYSYGVWWITRGQPGSFRASTSRAIGSATSTFHVELLALEAALQFYYFIAAWKVTLKVIASYKLLIHKNKMVCGGKHKQVFNNWICLSVVAAVLNYLEICMVSVLKC